MTANNYQDNDFHPGFTVGTEEDRPNNAQLEALLRKAREQEEQEAADLETYRINMMHALLRLFEKDALAGNDYIFASIERPQEKSLTQRAAAAISAPVQTYKLKTGKSLLLTTPQNEILIHNEGEQRGVYFENNEIDIDDAILGATLAFNQRQEGDPLTSISGTLEQRWMLTLAAHAVGLELENPVDLSQIVSPNERAKLEAIQTAFMAELMKQGLIADPNATTAAAETIIPDVDPFDVETLDTAGDVELDEQTEPAATPLELVPIAAAVETTDEPAVIVVVQNVSVTSIEEPASSPAKVYDGVSVDVQDIDFSLIGHEQKRLPYEEFVEVEKPGSSVIVVNGKGIAEIQTDVGLDEDFGNATTTDEADVTAPTADTPADRPRRSFIAGGNAPRPSA